MTADVFIVPGTLTIAGTLPGVMMLDDVVGVRQWLSVELPGREEPACHDRPAMRPVLDRGDAGLPVPILAGDGRLHANERPARSPSASTAGRLHGATRAPA